MTEPWCFACGINKSSPDPVILGCARTHFRARHIGVWVGLQAIQGNDSPGLVSVTAARKQFLFVQPSNQGMASLAPRLLLWAAPGEAPQLYTVQLYL